RCQGGQSQSSNAGQQQTSKHKQSLQIPRTAAISPAEQIAGGRSLMSNSQMACSPLLEPLRIDGQVLIAGCAGCNVGSASARGAGLVRSPSRSSPVFSRVGR